MTCHPLLRGCFLFLGLAQTIHSHAQLPVKVAVKDQLTAVESPVMSGFIADKLNLSYENRILAQDAGRLISPFLNRTETSCWQSEFWGKWFTSALLAYRYRPEERLKKIMDKSVVDLLATQTPDGYIGNYAPGQHLQAWDIWGRKYCMLGLIGYYDLTHNAQSLAAAGKIADHLIRELSEKNALIVRLGNHRGMAASSVLEPVVLLYTRTGNKNYLDLAEEIVREWETPEGPQLISKSITPVAERFPRPKGSWYGWEQGQKAYEMMSCYEGLLELYRVTGREQYKNAVIATWQSIRDKELNIAGSGSAMECWFNGKVYQTLPVNHYQETCVTATWIKLSQQLLRLTGEARYADAIEQTYYNALLGAMYADGSDWAKYTPLSGERLKGEEQCHMGINCCEASGPRGLFTLPLTAVMKKTDGVSINFFAAGRYTIVTPSGQKVIVEQITDYPVSGNISIIIHLSRPEDFVINIRRPEWSNQTKMNVNGDSIAPGRQGEFTTIRRTWKQADKISLILDMRGLVHKGGELGEYFAITRGPLVLARDVRLDGGDPGQPLTPVVGPDNYIALTLEKTDPAKCWVRLQASFIGEYHGEGGPRPQMLSLCDYASAGSSFDQNSRFRTWLPRLVDSQNLPLQPGQP